MLNEELKKCQKIKKTISIDKFLIDEISKIQFENRTTFSKVINFLLNDYFKNNKNLKKED